MTDNELTSLIIGCAIEVHKELGPGLLESAYELSLAHEFDLKGIQYERQKELPILYKGNRLGSGYRIDLLVEGRIIVELKSVQALTELNGAQLLSYLRLSKMPLGLLINFNVAYLKQGIKRIINNYNAQPALCS